MGWEGSDSEKGPHSLGAFRKEFLTPVLTSQTLELTRLLLAGERSLALILAPLVYFLKRPSLGEGEGGAR